MTRKAAAALAQAAKVNENLAHTNAASLAHADATNYPLDNNSSSSSSGYSVFEAIRAAFPGGSGTGLISPASSLSSLPDSPMDTVFDSSPITSAGGIKSEDMDTVFDSGPSSSAGEIKSEEMDQTLAPNTPLAITEGVSVDEPSQDTVQRLLHYLPPNPSRVCTRDGEYIRFEWMDFNVEESSASVTIRTRSEARRVLVAAHQAWKAAEAQRDAWLYGTDDELSDSDSSDYGSPRSDYDDEMIDA